MSLWKTIKEWFVSNAEQLLVVPIADPKAGEAIVPNQTYFGLWLAHGFLRRDVEWFAQKYPAVHVSARLDVAGTTTTLTKLAQPSEGMLGPGVWEEFPITGLVPYRGGIVEVEAGLSALERSSYLGAAVDVITGFSGMVAPPLSEVITIAGKVSDGVQKLLEAGSGDIVLGLHQAFNAPGGGGDHQLAPGYLAVVKATAGKLDPAALRIDGGRLAIQDGEEVKLLEGFDYMLFRIEGRRERDDWRFEHFDALIAKAIDAHFAGKADDFAAYRSAVLAEILKSPDLTTPDRYRVARAVEAELDQVTALGQGAVGREPSNLEQIVKQRAGSIDDPVATSEISLAELLKGQSAG